MSTTGIQEAKLSEAFEAKTPQHEAATCLSSNTSLVRYRANEEPRVSRSLRVQVWALWIVVGLGLITLLQMTGYQRAIKDIELSQTQSMTDVDRTLNSENRQVRDLTGKLQHLTNVVTDLSTESSQRFSGMGEQLAAETRTARQIDSRLDHMELVTAGSTTVFIGPETSSLSQSGANTTGHAVNDRLNRVDQASSPVKQEKLLTRHIHNFDLSIPLVQGAMVHTNAMKEQDYWQLPPPGRATGFAPYTRVIPFEVNKSGVRVHCIDDGFDYTLSISGEWLPN